MWEMKLDEEKKRTMKQTQTISKFVTKVHSAYKSKNDDVYIKKLMDLYKEFVEENMSQVLENKKKDPDTINELGRQLAYINKSIATLKAATIKNQAKTKENIMDRMTENKKLIR
jgi:cell division septum initiation protein DivIVA